MATLLAVVLAAGIAACGKSKSASSLSAADRVSTAQVCAQAGTDVESAGSIAAKLASKSITPPEAKAQLQPIEAKVASLAQQHASLPVGAALQGLDKSLTDLQAVNSSNAGDFVTPGKAVGTAVANVVKACAGAV